MKVSEEYSEFLSLMVQLGLRDLSNQKRNINLKNKRLKIKELILYNFEGMLNLYNNSNLKLKKIVKTNNQIIFL